MISSYTPVKQFRLPARRVLKDTVDAIRDKRNLTRKDLAEACGFSESWISKIYAEDKRTFSIHILDKIADELGVEVHHLFQPGISKRVENRTGGERRSGQDRGREAGALR